MENKCFHNISVKILKLNATQEKHINTCGQQRRSSSGTTEI